MRWATVDTSPFHGYDWIMAGAMVVAAQQTVYLFHLANRYIENNQTRALLIEADLEDADVSDLDKEISAARAILTDLLISTQGSLVGCGSGKCDVRYKLHGLVHSQRTQSCSWRSTARNINSYFFVHGRPGHRVTLAFLQGQVDRCCWHLDRGYKSRRRLQHRA